MAETAQTQPSNAELYRDIFNASPIGIAVENLEGQPLFVNPALCSMLGFSEEEMCNKHCVLFSSPEDAEKDWALFQQLRAGSIDHYQLEKRYFRKDGSLFWGRLSLSLLKGRSSPLVVARVEDITDERRADEALRASEERLRLAQQAAHIGTFEWNVQTGVNSWTPELEAMYGLPPGGFGGTQEAFENLVHPDDRAGVIQLNNWALKTGKPTEGEWRVVWPDGSVHWIAGRWQVFLNESGEPLRMVGVNGEITERKSAEEALRESERRFRLATQAGKMYAFEWDVATDKILRCGDVASVLGSTGDPPSTRQELWARIHPDDRERFTASVTERTVENPDVQISYRLLRPDGSVIWLEKTAHAFFDGEGRVVRMLGMVTDVTECRRAEETLRLSEEKFRSIFREAGVGMVIVSPEGHFLAVNDRFCEYLGYTEEELLGVSVQSVTVEEDWPGFSQKLSEVLTEGRSLQRLEKRCLHKSGSIVYTESSVSLMRDSSGSPQYFVGEVLDVTKRKEAEEALANVNRRLIESQEQERARIGRELHDDIAQRLGMLSVELEQLQDNPAEVRSRVQELLARTTEISNDVQALSHELHASKLEYLGAVAGMRSWCKEFAQRHDMEIDFKSDVSSALPAEIGLCLFRVLQESLQNVIKHSGVKRVEVRLMEESRQVHLIVSDSGRGFDVGSAMQGKGLGLTSMRERIRLVNGTIAIEAKPVGGTTIEVRVPLESQHSSQQAS
jgi:PAS domain S-box-containing protein